MRQEEIVTLVKSGMQTLTEKDDWLLTNDLSERSIAHRLAHYLEHLFIGYDVDCEYNGAIHDGGYQRKKVHMVKRDLLHIEMELRERERHLEVDETIERSAYPDIIIHKRGHNDDNLCIIEIKKTTNIVGASYDEIKLRSYTRHELDKALCYQLGLFIEIVTGSDKRDCLIRYFKNGEEFIPERNDNDLK